MQNDIFFYSYVWNLRDYLEKILRQYLVHGFHMPGGRFMASILLTIATTTIGAASMANAAAVDVNLGADLKRVAQRRIFFGHQSVGVNLLDGVSQLAAMVDVPLHIVEVKAASDVKSAMIGHEFLAENGYPRQKLKSFEKAMDLQPKGLDIAMMKFCFVDFTAETDAKSLFASYQATIDGLRTKNPGTTFIHVTAPLTIVQGGLRTRMKQLFGHAPYGTLENLRREEYNTLLRQAYQGRAPIFDLARVESTTQSGAAVTVEWEGKTIPVMAPAYTDDGGHLNEAGKIRAARELISILAAIPDRPAVR